MKKAFTPAWITLEFVFSLGATCLGRCECGDLTLVCTKSGPNKSTDTSLKRWVSGVFQIKPEYSKSCTLCDEDECVNFSNHGNMLWTNLESREGVEPDGNLVLFQDTCGKRVMWMWLVLLLINWFGPEQTVLCVKKLKGLMMYIFFCLLHMWKHPKNLILDFYWILLSINWLCAECKLLVFIRLLGHKTHQQYFWPTYNCL